MTRTPSVPPLSTLAAVGTAAAVLLGGAAPAGEPGARASSKPAPGGGAAVESGESVPQPSPYAAHTGRRIKALSADEVEGLLAGRGMGLAMAAELNGYPGPKHVLELAGELELTEEQRAAVTRSFDAMHREAVALGREVVEAEAGLDALFAEGEATPEALRAALEEIGALRGELRNAHLQAHLETRDLLTDEQVRRYQELRGYGEGGAGHPHPGHHHPGHQPPPPRP